MLSLAASRSKKPSAQPPDPNIRLGFGETAAGGLSFCTDHVAVRESGCGPLRRLMQHKRMSAPGVITEVATGWINRCL